MDSKLKAVNDEEKSSLSSYGSAESDKEKIDYTEKIMPVNSSRTVLSFSAKNNNALVLNTNGNGENSEYELHRLVFFNDISGVRRYIERFIRANLKIRSEALSMKDKYENTPLHLACMLGHIEISRLLVLGGATVKIRNKQSWTPLNEAISFGSRDLIRFTLEKFEKEVEQIVDDSKPKIVSALKEMDDFYVEIKWDFESWIPFVSRFLPSDCCKLYKKGSQLRLDCTLGDVTAGSGGGKDSAANSVGSSISPFRWERGDLSFLFEIEKVGSKNSIFFMNNNKKTYFVIDSKNHKEFQIDLDKEVDLLLSKEMIFIKLNTKQALFSPTQIGWLGFNKRDKIEVLNGYLCQFFDINNLYIVTKLRVEHLSEEELKKREDKQLAIKKHLSSSVFSSGKSNDKNENSNNNDDKDMRGLDEIAKELEEDIEYRPSLTPPPKNQLSWNEYIESNSEQPVLGRKPKLKESKKEFKAQIAMSQEFPLTVPELDKLLDALVPLAKFRKLKEFINLKLPPGFPVKIDIPIVPSVSAKVCFQNFKKDCNHSADLFRIPSDYIEEQMDSPCDQK